MFTVPSSSKRIWPKPNDFLFYNGIMLEFGSTIHNMSVPGNTISLVLVQEYMSGDLLWTIDLDEAGFAPDMSLSNICESLCEMYSGLFTV